MKKNIVILLAALLLSGCGNNEVQPEASETSQTETTTAATETTAVTTTAEKVTTAKRSSTTVTTEEIIPLTPLEEARAWAGENPYKFLYDITGDGFPERFDIFFYDDLMTVNVNSAIYTWDHYINTDEKIYVCRDNDGRIFLAAYDEDFFTAGLSRYSALRYDFYSNDIKTTSIAWVNIYTYPWWEESGDSYYTYGSDIFADYAGTIDHYAAENLLADYISGYELLDIIEIKYENGSCIVSFGADSDFSEECADDLPEYERKSEPIIIDGEIYQSDVGNIVLRPKQVEGDFDFDILNRFENLEDIDFVCEHPEGEKTVIKTGEWCKKIKSLQVDAKAYDTTKTDFSAFTNVESININGYGLTRENLEFLKDMPSIKIIYAFFTADSAETFIPISELPNLEAIIDSGQLGYAYDLNEEEREKVSKLLPKDKYFLGMIK